MMKERLTHIDNAKAIGMILIIASHIIPSEPVVKNVVYMTWCNVLNSFYVPLFFLLSGMFEPSAADDKKLLRRVTKLLRYCVAFYAFGIVADGVISNHWSLSAFRSQTTIWFLIVLLWITAIVGILKHCKYRLCIYLVLTMGGVMLAHKSMGVFYIGQACVCLPFYLVGYYAKDYFKSKTLNKKALVLSVMTWLILFSLFYCPQNISLNMIGQNFFAFYLEAIAGSIMVIEWCKLIDVEFISYFGRNSIVPMMVQLPLIWIVQMLVDVECLSSYFIMSVVVCAICGLCIPIFRNKGYDMFG